MYQVGENRVDHPPLFACREHKSILRLNEKFVKDLLRCCEDSMPGNLAEYSAPLLGGSEEALRLPDYLIPPRVVIFNPDGLRGPKALPFTLVFIDKRFVGIPAAYFTSDRFDGCEDCGQGGYADDPASSAAGRAHTPARGAPMVRPNPSLTGSGVVRAVPPSGGAPGRPGSGLTRPAGGPPKPPGAIRKPPSSPDRPAGSPPPRPKG